MCAVLMIRLNAESMFDDTLSIYQLAIRRHLPARLLAHIQQPTQPLVTSQQQQLQQQQQESPLPPTPDSIKSTYFFNAAAAAHLRMSNWQGVLSVFRAQSTLKVPLTSSSYTMALDAMWNRDNNPRRALKLLEIMRERGGENGRPTQFTYKSLFWMCRKLKFQVFSHSPLSFLTHVT